MTSDHRSDMADGPKLVGFGCADFNRKWKRGVTEFFDEPLRGFVGKRAAVQSAEFVLIQHMVKIACGILGDSQVYKMRQ